MTIPTRFARSGLRVLVLLTARTCDGTRKIQKYKPDILPFPESDVGAAEVFQDEGSDEHPSEQGGSVADWRCELDRD